MTSDGVLPPGAGGSANQQRPWSPPPSGPPGPTLSAALEARAAAAQGLPPVPASPATPPARPEPDNRFEAAAPGPAVTHDMFEPTADDPLPDRPAVSWETGPTIQIPPPEEVLARIIDTFSAEEAVRHALIRADDPAAEPSRNTSTPSGASAVAPVVPHPGDGPIPGGITPPDQAAMPTVAVAWPAPDGAPGHQPTPNDRLTVLAGPEPASSSAERRPRADQDGEAGGGLIRLDPGDWARFGDQPVPTRPSDQAPAPRTTPQYYPSLSWPGLTPPPAAGPADGAAPADRLDDAAAPLPDGPAARDDLDDYARRLTRLADAAAPRSPTPTDPAVSDRPTLDRLADRLSPSGQSTSLRPTGQADQPAPFGQSTPPPPTGPADPPAPFDQSTPPPPADQPPPFDQSAPSAPTGQAYQPAPTGQTIPPAPTGQTEATAPVEDSIYAVQPLAAVVEAARQRLAGTARSEAPPRSEAGSEPEADPDQGEALPVFTVLSQTTVKPKLRGNLQPSPKWSDWTPVFPDEPVSPATPGPVSPATPEPAPPTDSADADADASPRPGETTAAPPETVVAPPAVEATLEQLLDLNLAEADPTESAPDPTTGGVWAGSLSEVPAALIEPKSKPAAAEPIMEAVGFASGRTSEADPAEVLWPTEADNMAPDRTDPLADTPAPDQTEPLTGPAGDPVPVPPRPPLGNETLMAPATPDQPAGPDPATVFQTLAAATRLAQSLGAAHSTAGARPGHLGPADHLAGDAATDPNAAAPLTGPRPDPSGPADRFANPVDISGLTDPQPVAPRRPQSVGRITVAKVEPVIEGGAHPAKAVVGEDFPIRARVFREGHDQVGASVVLTDPDGRSSRHDMTQIWPEGLDIWEVWVSADRTGDWSFRVEGWADPWATWVHVAAVKLPQSIDLELVYADGHAVLRRAEAEARQAGRRNQADQIEAWADLLTIEPDPQIVLDLLQDEGLQTALRRWRPRELVSPTAEFELVVDRQRALFSAWYEFFPRSQGARRQDDGSWLSGTLDASHQRLEAIAAMGFDVAYLPPIHPIGHRFRKGKNNSLAPGASDPGSPWAIGSAAGGHDAIHPDLGDFAAFDRFIAKAKSLGLEVALDFALQASPDHPWLRDHPQWFTTRADGSIAYAENPPKKYQDIYPLNFDNDPAGLYRECHRLLEFWIDKGVTIFRVDNPHTKPLQFWAWLLARVRARHPEVLFLAEAFTRPEMMQALAQVGFHQSYTYYTWRTAKWELEEYLTELSSQTAHFFRPNFFVNTPDINPLQIRSGRPAAFAIRAILAATLSPSWGVYSGYELYECQPLKPDGEEYLNSEKYEYRPRDFNAEPNLNLLLTTLNLIRRSHPALQQLRRLDFHPTSDEQVVAFSKRAGADRVLVVCSLDPEGARQARLDLDLEALGLTGRDRFAAHDALTGATWQWDAQPFVVLTPDQPAHIVTLPAD